MSCNQLINNLNHVKVYLVVDLSFYTVVKSYTGKVSRKVVKQCRYTVKYLDAFIATPLIPCNTILMCMFWGSA